VSVSLCAASGVLCPSPWLMVGDGERVFYCDLFVIILIYYYYNASYNDYEFDRNFTYYFF